MLKSLIQENRERILMPTGGYGITKLRIFGSVAKQDNSPTSDLDLIVTFEEGRSLFDLIGFKQELEDLLHVGVDVVTENSIHWSLRDEILKGAITL
ncbi:nucleotidyltransferase family protein [Bacillus marasmi]|uniref:nucleotidyltransferase family protein n=1 Tax=Bacillus marasmi TaxID=1926279 RepID=UPI001C9C470C|nr:nucleotidyltransferase family protein [Bacillus marasmi]